MQGGQSCIPLYPREGLSESFVDPAIAWLSSRGATLQTGRRIAGMATIDSHITALETADGPIRVEEGDAVVLAVPPWVATTLLPWLVAPDAFEAILNVHFRLDATLAGALAQAGFLGLIGGTAEWLFLKPGVVSITISAGNRLVDLPAETIAARVWDDVRAALGVPDPMPPVRVVKEKRATFAATAAQEARRPGPRTKLGNLALAGDWTATGLPATIEGAIRSGRAAAEVLRRGQD
jgi:hypothetical protein